ncbi:MAG: hypothetical protein SangKO_071980 [Sandaracinaceae bacterium]
MNLVAFTPDRFAAPLLAGWLVCVAIGCANDRTVESDAMITFETPDGGAAEDASRPPEPSVGDACEVDEDCPEDAPICLISEAYRGGYCTDICPEEGANTCPAGSHCTPIDFRTRVCLLECDPRAEKECRPGYGCAEGGPDASVCAPGCDLDSDCPDGLLCNADDGTLGEGRCYDPDAALGDPCTEPEDCDADGWCVRERDRGWPGGACTIFRCNEVDDTGCEGDAHCVFHFYRDPICVDGCEADADCRSGYACRPDETYPDRNICMPSCQATDCAGLTCNADTGFCE